MRDSPSAPHHTESLSSLGIVTVTYRPDLEVLDSQLSGLPDASLKVWVENSVDRRVQDALEARSGPRRDLVLFVNQENVGLAGALNQGARIAVASRADLKWILFLDQDTEPPPGAVAELLAAMLALGDGSKRACIGPRMVDAATELDHGFHQISWCRWVRRHPVAGPLVDVANLNGSGMLVSRQLFESLGGFDEALFIDHVDTEWSFRALAAGNRLLGVPYVAFRHRMGERTVRYWLGRWRAWPYRAPARQEQLFANTIRLLRRPYVAACWKLWAPVKLLLTAIVHALFDGKRRAQLAGMARGVRRGLAEQP